MLAVDFFYETFYAYQILCERGWIPRSLSMTDVVAIVVCHFPIFTYFIFIFTALRWSEGDKPRLLTSRVFRPDLINLSIWVGM